MKFRTATKRDVDRIAEIDLVAYPDDRTIAAREPFLLRHPLGGDLVVAVEDGVILAQARLHAFRTSFGGQLVDTGGIASVAVAPEARGRGLGTAIVEELHRRSAARGDAVTMLYAFQAGFYARLGYARASSRRRLEIHPRALPDAWRIPVRRLDRVATVARLYAAALPLANGWFARPAAYWERFVANERRTVLVAERGYVAFFVEQERVHGPARIVVDEIVTVDPATRRGLLAVLGAFRDQVTAIVVEVADDDPLERALGDVDRGRFTGDPSVEHALGTIVGGPMVRVADVARAVAARGYARDGSFDLAIDGEGYRVVVHDGRATARPGRMRGRALRTTQAGLAAILYGALPVAAAVDLGLATCADPGIGAILALRPLVPIDAF